jgi:hypothetical protein
MFTDYYMVVFEKMKSNKYYNLMLQMQYNNLCL